MIKELAEGTKFGDNYSELVMEISQCKINLITWKRIDQ